MRLERIGIDVAINDEVSFAMVVIMFFNHLRISHLNGLSGSGDIFNLSGNRSACLVGTIRIQFFKHVPDPD